MSRCRCAVKLVGAGAEEAVERGRERETRRGKGEKGMAEDSDGRASTKVGCPLTFTTMHNQEEC